MTKFKIGDRVKDITDHHEIFQVPAPALGTIEKFEDSSYYINWDNKNMGPSNWHDDQLELVPDTSLSPVRTETRQVIVPGVYGYVEVSDRYGYAASKRIGIFIASYGEVHRDMGASELRAASDVFLALADALESNK